MSYWTCSHIRKLTISPFVNVTFTEPVLRQTMPLCSILTTYTALPPCALSESAGFVNPDDVRASIFVFLQTPYWYLEQCSSCWRTYSGLPKKPIKPMASCLCWRQSRHPGTGCFYRDTCLLSTLKRVVSCENDEDDDENWSFHQNPFCITSFITETLPV